MNQSQSLAVNPKQAVALVQGHFGELAQGLTRAGGPVALITLPCPVFETRIGYVPARGALFADDPVAAKTLAAVRLTLAELGADGWGGEIAIDRPVAPGLGAGSSTAETLGAVRAVARAFGLRLDPGMEATLCLAAEGAVDPLMHDGSVLFASREARVIEALAPLPPMTVTGGFAGAPSPTDPSDGAYADMGDVFRAIAEAAEAGDLAALARAAERSAERNQAARPNPAWAAVGEIAAATGALGRVVAHSGAAIGLIFPPGAGEAAEMLLGAAGLATVRRWTLPGRGR